MRRLNGKRLFLVLTTTGLVVAGLFLVHWLQTGRIARSFLARADRADQQGNLEETARFLARYLEIEADDLDARIRLGQALASDKLAQTPKARVRALFVLEQILAKKPDRRDLRLQLVHLAMDVQRRDLAREHLAILIEGQKDDGEVEFLFGQVCDADEQWDKAAAWYEATIKHKPQQIDAYVRLADLNRRRLTTDKPAEMAARADKVMQELVDKNPDAVGAYLATWRYLQQWVNMTEPANLAKAQAAITRATALAPQNLEVLLAATDMCQVRRRLETDPLEAAKHVEEARKLLVTARGLFPKDVRVWRESAWLELREKENKDHRKNGLALLKEGAKQLIGGDRNEMLWMQANVLIDCKQIDDAQSLIAEISRGNPNPATVDYLEARIHVDAGRWAEAVKLLERSRELLSSSAELGKQADFLLAHCYEQLNNPDLQLAALRRIVQRDSTSVPGLLARASVQAAQGQYDDAIAQYRLVVKLPTAPAAAWIDLARTTLQKQLQLPRPDWKAIEETIAQAEAKNPEALEIPLFRVESLVAQARQEKGPAAEKRWQHAHDLLEAALTKFPKRVEVYVALANFAELQKQPDQAGRYLDDAGKTLGDSVVLRQGKAQLWARRGGEEAKKTLTELSQGMDKFSAPDQARLLLELADAQARLGNFKDAGAIWAQLAAQPVYKNDLRLRLLQFDAVFQVGDETSMRRVIDEIRGIEGESGVSWRHATALLDIWQARQGRPEKLDEARTLLDAVIAKRPSWPAALIALADLEDMKGNADQSIANYRKAIDLGERTPRVVRQLVQQLYKRQRYDEADQEVRKLQAQSSSPELNRWVAAIALQRDDASRAIGAAMEAVQTDSTDYRDHLWLGRVLATAGQKSDEAEKHFRRAIELGGDKQETWVVLVQFLANQKKTKEAEEAIAQIRTRVPADQVALTQALCYQAIGQLDKAEENYQVALKARPDDPQTLRGISTFYLRTGRLSLAEPHLRRLLDNKGHSSNDDTSWAKRILAQALATSGDYRRYPEALALVGLKVDAQGKISETGPAEDAAQQRARVAILTTQSRREYRQQAVSILGELARKEGLSAEDQFTLARLYLAGGEWPKARDQFRQLTLQSKDPRHLVVYAEALLQQKDLSEAERCIARLEKVEKSRQMDVGALGSIELRAQLLEVQGQPAKALELLTKYASGPNTPAERIFVLAAALSRQKKHAEALLIFDKLRATCPTELIAAVGGNNIAALRAGGNGAEQATRVADWLKAVGDKATNKTAILLQRAELEDLRGHYDEAEGLYREVLAVDKQNVVAMNNLAWFLAQKPNTAAEGLTLINQAVAQVGPQPNLLDTRATLFLALGKTEQAIADLEVANADRPGPTNFFHLAQAQRQANNPQAAVALIQKATASGLMPEHLHPVERVAYLKLLSELNQK